MGGTLTLPSGSFSNALKVRYNSSKTDSSFVGIPFLTVTTQTSYLWFVPDKKFPVFQISYVNIVINGMQTSSTKQVAYSPNNPPIGITQLGTNVPEEFRLFQNYPNPFNPSTKIRFDIKKENRGSGQNITLTIYDELGREITKLVNESLSPGVYEVDWNDENLPGGVYYYRLTAGNYTVSRKMLLIK
jgi:hypothetical protein